MEDLKTLRTGFVKKLEVLDAREKKIEQEMREASEPDSQERAVEQENSEVLQGLDRQTAGEIEMIRNAIRRIDTGTYGKCTKCGKTISAQRLAALPNTPTCNICA